MEIKGIDFTKRKKDVLTVIVGTENEPIEIKMLPPTKSIHEGMLEVAGYIEKSAKGELDYSEVGMGECLSLVSQAMSNNTDLRQITPEYLDSIGFDLSDIGEFLGLYLYFLTELTTGKN